MTWLWIAVRSVGVKTLVWAAAVMAVLGILLYSKRTVERGAVARERAQQLQENLDAVSNAIRVRDRSRTDDARRDELRRKYKQPPAG